MSNSRPIVCLGIMVADVVGRPLAAVPDPGRLVLVDEMSLHTGGCAINVAVTLAHMDLPAAVVGKVGNDSFADFLLHQLETWGVDTNAVSSEAEVGTSATMVLVEPDGERRFVHYMGANTRLTLADINFTMIEKASQLHVAGALVLPGLDGQPMATLLQQAKAAGVTTFLDTVWDDTGRWMELLAPSLPYVDYFLPSLAEAQALTELDEPGEVARALLGWGVGTVGLKMGDQGCLVMSASGDALFVPAFAVEAVDATGAGDAFVAGFIAGVRQGWPLAKTARLANAVGALCVTGVGATGSVRSWTEIVAFMNATPTRE